MHGTNLEIFYKDQLVFDQWKSNFKEERHTLFITTTGNKVLSGKRIIYYYCHRSGYLTPSGQNLRALNSQGHLKTDSLALGVHPQWGLPYLVCVYVSFTTFSATTRNKLAKKWHQLVQRYTGLIVNLAIFVNCVFWRHKKSQRRAYINLHMLSTSPCQTLNELHSGRPRVAH